MNEEFLKNPKAADVLNKPRFGGFPGMGMGSQVIESDKDRIIRLARMTFNHQRRVGEIPEDAVFVPPVFEEVPAPALAAPVPVVQIVQPVAAPVILKPAADPSATPPVGAPGTVQIPAPLKSPGQPAESPVIASLQAVPVKMPGDDPTSAPPAAAAVAIGSVPADAPANVPPGKRAPEDPQPPAKV